MLNPKAPAVQALETIAKTTHELMSGPAEGLSMWEAYRVAQAVMSFHNRLSNLNPLNLDDHEGPPPRPRLHVR